MDTHALLLGEDGLPEWFQVRLPLGRMDPVQQEMCIKAFQEVPDIKIMVRTHRPFLLLLSKPAPR